MMGIRRALPHLLSSGATALAMCAVYFPLVNQPLVAKGWIQWLSLEGNASPQKSTKTVSAVDFWYV